MPMLALLLLSSALGRGIGLDAAANPSGPLAWPAGLLEVRIAFPDPIPESALAELGGTAIPFQTRSAGDLEHDAHDAHDEETSFIRIGGARVEDDGRTLVLLTDPHPIEAEYQLDSIGSSGPIRYDLTGVEVSWTAEGDREPEWVGWLPELDLAASREAVAGSIAHDRLVPLLKRPGTLELRTLLALPEGESLVSLRSDRTFEAEMMFEPIEVGPDHEAEHVIDTFGEPAELFLLLPTGPGAGSRPPSFSIHVRKDGEDEAGPLPSSLQILPWAPAPIEHGEEAPALPDALLGGDPVRGEVIFFGEQANCATCHRVGDRGGEVGPNLSGIAANRTLAQIYRDIEAPSSKIEPEYLPYTVAMGDGRVFVGMVRAEGPDLIEIVGADAEAVRVERAAIEEIGPVSTSIMPVGLAGAIGQDDLRDLLAYLAGCRDD